MIFRKSKKCLNRKQILLNKVSIPIRPKIEKAIKELKSAIEYIEKAHHDFGGHKADAIVDSKKAVQSLKLALKYRAKTDNNKKK